MANVMPILMIGAFKKIGKAPKERDNSMNLNFSYRMMIFLTLPWAFFLSPVKSYCNNSWQQLSKKLKVESVHDIRAPKYEEVSGTEFLKSTYVQRVKSDQKSRPTVSKVEVVYRKVQFTFRNGFFHRTGGFIYLPQPNYIKNPPVVFYFHDEYGGPNPDVAEELRFVHSGQGMDEEGWTWLEHFMNQGYVVVSLNSPGYGVNHNSERVDYQKKYQVSRDQMRLYNDILMFKHVLTKQNWDLGRMAFAAETSGIVRARSFLEALGEDPNKVVSLPKVAERSKWPYLKIYGILARWNQDLFSKSHAPRMKESFRKEMIRQKNNQRAEKSSCQNQLSETKADIVDQQSLFEE